MRIAKTLAALLLPAAVLFLASPLVTVWLIRDAIQSGDARYLEAKIEWPTVRESLRASLIATSAPAPDTAADADAAAPPAPSLWQRLKTGLAKRAIDKMVESYVTPEGLPELFSYRKMYRTHVSGDPNAGLSWHQRLRGFWSRVKRAEWKSLTAFEIEMADRNHPTRHFVGLLALRGTEWKLTELRVKEAV